MDISFPFSLLFQKNLKQTKTKRSWSLEETLCSALIQDFILINDVLGRFFFRITVSFCFPFLFVVDSSRMCKT